MIEDANRHHGPVEEAMQQILQCIRELESNNTLSSDQAQLIDQSKTLLSEVSTLHNNRMQLYASLLSLILYSFVNYLPAAGGDQMHEQLLELIQKLQPPLANDDLSVIYNTLYQVSDQLSKGGLLNLDQVSAIINPLLGEFAAKAQSARQAKPARSNTEVDAAQGDNSKIHAQKNPSARYRSRRYLRDTNKIGYDVLDAMSFDNQATQYSGDIKTLQQEFIQQLRRAVLQISQFAKQLERDIAFINALEPNGNVDAFKHSVIEMLHSLQHGHEAIALNFDGAKSYLRIIESGSQQLMDELDRVRILSLTDELTGLPNRRAFLRRVNTEVNRIVRYKHPLSLVLIDLDYFKRINDRFGHAVGDEVLKTYADSVFPLFRNHDLVARYGGEEFVILFPDTNLDGVQLALHKIREHCATIKVNVAEGNIALPDFSAGVAQYIDGENAEQFIERADRALYLAKQNGRGRTEIADYAPQLETES